MRLRTALVVLCLGIACTSAPRTPEEHARALFEQYVKLEKAYDPAIFDLYADEGRIEKYIITRSGERIGLGWVSAREWKERTRPMLEGAVRRDARNRYSDVTYEPNGDFIWVRMKRFQEPPGVTLAQEMLMGPDKSGRWFIWKEVAQAHSTRY